MEGTHGLYSGIPRSCLRPDWFEWLILRTLIKAITNLLSIFSACEVNVEWTFYLYEASVLSTLRYQKKKKNTETIHLQNTYQTVMFCAYNYQIAFSCRLLVPSRGYLYIWPRLDIFCVSDSYKIRIVFVKLIGSGLRHTFCDPEYGAAFRNITRSSWHLSPITSDINSSISTSNLLS